MGNEGACAAVHQCIAYKSGSVHMEPVPVVLGLQQTYFANCTLCSRYWRRDNISPWSIFVVPLQSALSHLKYITPFFLTVGPTASTDDCYMHT